MSNMACVAALSKAKRSLLQSYLDARATQPRVGPTIVAASSSSEPAPLTISQEQLIRRELNRPDVPPLYNECIQLRMMGPLDLPAFRRSFVEVVRRHEIWRTSFALRDGELLQIVNDSLDHAEMSLVDLCGLSRVKQEVEIGHLVGALLQKRFNLDRSTLRALLIKLNDLEHRFYLIAHLSVVDGVSVYQIFPYELGTLYRAYATQRVPELPRLPIQFRDYAFWQRRALETESIDTQLNYWKTQLAGTMPVLNWPKDHTRPARESFRGEIETFALPVTVVQAIKSFSRQEGVTLFAAKLSLLAALLHSYTRQDDFAMGTPSPSGRKRSELQGLLGYFLTPVALRFRITSRMTFRELMRQAQRLILEAISNDDLPVEVLAEKLTLKTDPTRNPVFTVAMSIQPPMPKLDLDWTVTSMDINSGGAPWDLYLAFIDRQEGMVGRAQYNPDIFEAKTIGRMIRDYQELARIVSASPNSQLAEIALHFDC